MPIKVAIEAARLGGEVLMELFGTNFRVDHKGEVDLVTEADQAAEAAIVALIRSRFPSHDILAEESDYHRQQQEFCWIIDPLDGTTNYAHVSPGLPSQLLWNRIKKWWPGSSLTRVTGSCLVL